MYEGLTDEDLVDMMLGKPRPIGVCRHCGGDVYLEGEWPRPACRVCRKMDMPICAAATAAPAQREGDGDAE